MMETKKPPMPERRFFAFGSLRGWRPLGGLAGLDEGLLAALGAAAVLPADLPLPASMRSSGERRRSIGSSLIGARGRQRAETIGRAGMKTSMRRAAAQFKRSCYPIVAGLCAGFYSARQVLHRGNASRC